MNTVNIMPALPEIFIITMACAILIADLYLGQRLPRLAYALTLFTLGVAALITLTTHVPGQVLTFNGMFVDDTLADVLKVAIYALAIFVFIYSEDYLRTRGIHRSEYFVLGLFGVVGMMVMVSASHFLTLYLGLELFSLSLYAMVAFQRDSSLATEAAMKYFILGALASGMLLYGMSMLYGATGGLEIYRVQQSLAQLGGTQDTVLVFGLVFVVVGLAFKLGAVPFHMWVPDVYHGAPTAVTLYIGSVPKIAAFAMFMRLLVGALPDLSAVWSDMLVILAVLSMATGNLVAIAQTNIKRMLAYSTISHMGFFLLGILSANPNGYSSAMFYVLIYASMSLGAFGVLILLSRAGFEAENLDDLKGLNQRSPWFAFVMLLLMFSMAGVPPTVGFFAKLSVIQAVVDRGQIWLAVTAVLLSVVGAFYYIRVIKLMYFDAPVETAPVQGPVGLRLLLSVNGLAMILITPWVGSLILLCQAAIAG